MIVLAFLLIGVIAAALPVAGLQRTRRRGAAAAPGSDIELEQAISSSSTAPRTQP
jgi:hypothetical protein